MKIWGPVSLVVACFFCSSLAYADEPKKVFTREEFDTMMAEIKQFDPSNLSEVEREDAGEVWTHGMPRSSKMNLRMLKSYETPRDKMREMLFEMVEGMGEANTGDFRLQLCVGSILSPYQRFKFHGDTPPSVHSYWVLSTIAEAQVRDWCQHPEKVEREVWMSAWSGRHRGKWGSIVFFTSAFGLEQHFDGPDVPVDQGGTYWQSARHFIFIACATNRTDLFAGCDPTKLKPKYEEWVKWARSIEQNPWHLRSSGYSPTWVMDPPGVQRPPRPNSDGEFEFPALSFIPSTPFPEWGNLPGPPKPKWFRDYADR